MGHIENLLKLIIIDLQGLTSSAAQGRGGDTKEGGLLA